MSQQVGVVRLGPDDRQGNDLGDGGGGGGAHELPRSCSVTRNT